MRLLLCSLLVAAICAVRVAPAASAQSPAEVLHVPELDAGFHLLYELKLQEVSAILSLGRSRIRKTRWAARRKRRPICLRSATVRAF